jgi:hypothetical protein|tara:strand:+ start:1037 stop:1402 length:366 start_codon:yes stop_codon:yes gene_type:complete
MKELKVVSIDDLHSSIRSFIIESNTIIGDYEDMKALILLMIRAGYMFNMDRDRLRDAMEDITFMLCPDDDANKDRVERGLEYDDDDEDEDDYDEESSQVNNNMGIDESIEDIGKVDDLELN